MGNYLVACILLNKWRCFGKALAYFLLSYPKWLESSIPAGVVWDYIACSGMVKSQVCWIPLQKECSVIARNNGSKLRNPIAKKMALNEHLGARTSLCPASGQRVSSLPNIVCMVFFGSIWHICWHYMCCMPKLCMWLFTVFLLSVYVLSVAFGKHRGWPDMVTVTCQSSLRGFSVHRSSSTSWFKIH